MACGLTTIPKADCAARKQLGGIRSRVYLGLRSEMTASPYTENVTTGAIEAIEMATSKKLVKVWGKKSPGGWSQNDVDGPNVYLEQTGSLIIEADTPATTKALNDMRGADDVVAIIEQRNGTFKVYGKEEGLMLKVSHETGTEFGDASGYTLNFSGAEIELAPEFFLTDYDATVALLEGYTA